ncbi:MAG: glycosyltransferase family 4 protein [Candidatus Zambryskibacteria bacterium]|nr:glycosyltransferase family 4 protein [Candidatus Zambryskibacteria bacterium]
MKKRALIYSIAYYPLVGGAEVAVKEITDRIPEIEWHMVTRRFDPTHPAYEIIGNVHVYRVSTPKILFPFVSFWKGRQLHKKSQFDAVWSMMTFAGFPGLFFKIFFPKVFFVLSLQEGTPFADIKRKVFFVYPLFRLMFKQADCVQVISQFLAQMARDIGRKKEIVVIPNGVYITLFGTEPSLPLVLSLAERLVKTEKDIYMVTTSRLSKKNGIDDAIRALVYLPEYVKFLIVGVGEDEAKLRALAQEMGVRERVWFAGFVDQKDIPVFLRVSDIFVRASRSEGFGNSFIEAMAAGLPVIATPVGGIPDFIDDKETGVFACADNPKSIAEAVMEIVQNPELREKIIRLGRERVLRRYSWDTVVSLMKEKVFQDLL